MRIAILVRDPRLPPTSVGDAHGLNRIVQWDARSVDEPVVIRWVPEGSRTSFNPPVIDGATVEIRVPGRILLGESTNGTEPVRRVRWSVLVSEGGRCDRLGGRPALRLVPAGFELAPRPRSVHVCRSNRRTRPTEGDPHRGGGGRPRIAGPLGSAPPRAGLTVLNIRRRMDDDAPVMDERWISFREGAWSSFGSTLPGSLPVGRGWRGGHVRGIDSIDGPRRLRPAGGGRRPERRSACGGPMASPTAWPPIPTRYPCPSCWTSI